MTDIWILASIWVGLALLATFASYWLGIASALSEILIGFIVQAIIVAYFGNMNLGENEQWITFLAGCGAVVLTFLAGAELEPSIFQVKWKQIALIGLMAFVAPFLGCAAFAYYVLHWTFLASWLCGVALSSTSVAVVYAVMLDLKLHKAQFGQVVLGACFINDLGTVLALGLIFSPFTIKTAIFVVFSIVIFFFLPRITKYLFAKFGDLPSEMETKYILFILFTLGALATWAGSEAVLPAYIIGILLASSVGKNHALIGRIRTLTLGVLTPFYFIRAGSLVSFDDLKAGPMILVLLLAAKMVTKFIGVYPATKWANYTNKEAVYTTLLMSTGLTFGTISAIYGLTNKIITEQQYSYLVAAVIGSAIVPTLIANAFFLPKHLIQQPVPVKTDEIEIL